MNWVGGVQFFICHAWGRSAETFVVGICGMDIVMTVNIRPQSRSQHAHEHEHGHEHE